MNGRQQTDRGSPAQRASAAAAQLTTMAKAGSEHTILLASPTDAGFPVHSWRSALKWCGGIRTAESSSARCFHGMTRGKTSTTGFRGINMRLFSTWSRNAGAAATVQADDSRPAWIRSPERYCGVADSKLSVSNQARTSPDRGQSLPCNRHSPALQGQNTVSDLTLDSTYIHAEQFFP